MRLFIAADIPPATRLNLRSLIERLRAEIDGPRWVRPEAIHLTFKFLGTVHDADLARLTTSLKLHFASATSPLCVSLNEIGTFPERGRPRVLWVGLKESRDGLQTAHRRVVQAVEAAALESTNGQDKAFRPHLTLARFGDEAPPSGLGSAIARCNEAFDLPDGTFTVASVCLFQSLLKPGGAEYRKLEEFPL